MLLFVSVRRPREAVHDSAYLLFLSKKSREQAQELKTDIVAFDNVTFMKKLVSFQLFFQSSFVCPRLTFR